MLIKIHSNFFLGMIYALTVWATIILINGENTSPWIIIFMAPAIFGTVFILGTTISWLIEHWDKE